MIRRQMGATRRYCAEAKALFARMTTQPNIIRKRLINDLIVDLKAAGVWTGFDALYVLAAHDAQAARLNWVSTSYDLTLGDTPTFTTDRGYAGNGSSDYLATGYNPLAHGVNWTLNDAGIFAWSRTTATGFNPACIATSFGYGYIQLNSNRLLGGLNVQPSPAIDGSIADGAGLFSISRTGASALTGYRNASVIDTGTATATARSDDNIVVLGAPNGAGTVTDFWPGELAAAGFGASRDGTEETAFYNALSTYMTSVGAI